MKCQILFSGENKKNISKCLLLKILPRVLSAKTIKQHQMKISKLILTLKVPFKIVADNIFFFLLLFRENEAEHFVCII